MVEPDLFRAAMCQIATPVVVVTAVSEERPHGTTVGAFTSVLICRVVDEREDEPVRRVRRGGASICRVRPLWTSARLPALTPATDVGFRASGHQLAASSVLLAGQPT